MATAAAKEQEENGIIDLSNPAAPVVIEESEIEAEVEVEIAQKQVTVRVNEEIDMSYNGTPYKMKVGPTYKIPKHVADWLEEKGIIWH